ncbi:YiiX family permuted papain-like enzyme [Escherichia coli]|nr:YiiX family permuted papain-like enzyme [Escherichia coli]
MKYRLLIPGLLVSVPAFAWQPQTGDIIFQISRSSQSKAIQLATHSDYSHTGMLVIRNKKPYVFEAVGPVKYTPLKQWIAHGEKGKYVVRRVEGGLSVEQQQKLAQTAKRYLGKPYDFSFSWSDDRQYCSEVVWKVYQNALGMRVGEQQKLKEFDLSNPLVQAKLKERYGEGGLSVEQQQKLAQTAKRYLGKPYDFSFSWSDDRQYCSEVVWKVYQNALGMRVGEQQKLKEFDLSNPLVQAKLKERYGKNIPLEETVVSPQAVFDAPQLTTVAKEWPLFSW